MLPMICDRPLFLLNITTEYACPPAHSCLWKTWNTVMMGELKPCGAAQHCLSTHKRVSKLQHLWYRTSVSHVWSWCVLSQQVKPAAAVDGGDGLASLMRHPNLLPAGHEGVYSLGGMRVSPTETTTTTTAPDGSTTVTVIKKSRFSTDKATVCITRSPWMLLLPVDSKSMRPHSSFEVSAGQLLSHDRFLCVVCLGAALCKSKARKVVGWLGLTCVAQQVSMSAWQVEQLGPINETGCCNDGLQSIGSAPNVPLLSNQTYWAVEDMGQSRKSQSSTLSCKNLWVSFLAGSAGL